MIEQSPSILAAKTRGHFIILEGIDNCGKTTQSNMLKDYLQSHGRQVIKAREPGGTVAGEQLRKFLLQKRRKLLNPLTQTLVFYAARAEFMQQIVKPNLDKGITLITDRFEPSTYVYQGIVQGVKTQFINHLSRQIVSKSGYRPDLCIILDISAQESFKRGSNEDNKGQDLIYERQGIVFMEKLRRGYLKFAKSHSDYTRVLDGNLNKHDLHQQIISLVDALAQKNLTNQPDNNSYEFIRV